jgi:hypothetical protein
MNVCIEMNGNNISWEVSKMNNILIDTLFLKYLFILSSFVVGNC